ncbi:hypothetical protein [Thiococcus pfennigii]|uniref:hypothetical protein n=1 Tax=Thiococcus pfennigii TaxID=1057 RepID=UPI0019033C1C|nr:hypothetical protein [Thiococcus pfennigii]
MTWDLLRHILALVAEYAPNMWCLALGLAIYAVVLLFYSAKGGRLIRDSEAADFELVDGKIIHYVTNSQVTFSSVLFLLVFWHLPNNATLSFSLIGILISVYLFFDKNLFWSVAETNHRTASLLREVRQLQGVESLPDLAGILRKINDILSAIDSDQDNRNDKVELYLVCASPALGALHDNEDVKRLSAKYQASIHQTATQLRENLKVVHYDPKESLAVFAEETGLAASRIEEFVRTAAVLSETLKQNHASVRVKQIDPTIAKAVFSGNDIPSAMLFHMMVVKYATGEAEMVLWHVERFRGDERGSQTSISVQGFWTTNPQLIKPFEMAASRYYD